MSSSLKKALIRQFQHPSGPMGALAGRRNRKGIAGGRIRLRVKPAEEYNGEDGPFDLVFAINAISFCSDPAGLVEKAGLQLSRQERLSAKPNPVLFIEGVKDCSHRTHAA